MKKRELVRLIKREGFVEDRPSQRHERYIKGDIIISLGRHDTVKPWEVISAKKAIKLGALK